jgi:hypothetical protein
VPGWRGRSQGSRSLLRIDSPRSSPVPRAKPGADPPGPGGAVGPDPAAGHHGGHFPEWIGCQLAQHHLNGSPESYEQPPGQPSGLTPGDWQNVYTESVTLDWSPAGAAAEEYQVTIYYHDGYDWRWYYDYTTSATSRTFWPYIGSTYYAWSVRGENDAGAGEWADFTAFYFGG